MLANLRRLLSHLPSIAGGRGDIYIKATWHKPTPFDQWKSQPPFRPAAHPPLRTEYFRRTARGPGKLRVALYGAATIGAFWLVVESVRGLAQL